MNSPTPDAIIILGHGSRVPEASQAMDKVANTLKEKYGYSIVETCNMSLLGPKFEETLAKCAEQGAKNIILIPYFLHEGIHMKIDVPKIMQRYIQKYPDVKLIFGKSLGFDPFLADIVQKRIDESTQLCDVRELNLPSEEEYPL